MGTQALRPWMDMGKLHLDVEVGNLPAAAPAAVPHGQIQDQPGGALLTTAGRPSIQSPCSGSLHDLSDDPEVVALQCGQRGGYLSGNGDVERASKERLKCEFARCELFKVNLDALLVKIAHVRRNHHQGHGRRSLEPDGEARFFC